MEIQLDELVNKIHHKNYAEAKQIAEELDRLLLEKNLSESQIAYYSSKIFNSPQNLFSFIEKNSEEKDRDVTYLRKYIFESICKYIILRKTKVLDYLETIKLNCFKLYKMDVSNVVKEASLMPIIKILKHFDNEQIKDSFDSDELANMLLDEIKLFKPSASVRGAIWHTLGLLTSQFPNQMRQYQVEIQDIMYSQLAEQFNSKKPEQKAIVGMLKGFRYCLEDSHLLDKQKDQMYLIMKVGMKQIEDIQRYKIINNSLKLLAKRHKLFKEYILGSAKDMFESLIVLTGHQNRDVKDNASEAFEAYITEVAEGLNDETLQQETFSYLMKRFQAIIDNPQSDIFSITVVIRAVGIFSKAMKVFMGEGNLKKFFSKLVELSTKVIRMFKEGLKEEKDTKLQGFFSFTGPTFKQVLSKQKQLNSFLMSFAHLISNIKSVSEKESTHLFELALIGMTNHNNYFSGYRPQLYDGIVSLIMSLSFHQNIFLFWLKKLISQGMLETLKVPENVYYAGEDYHKSLLETCEMWVSLIERPKIWSESCCKTFYDEIVSHVNELINNLDLSYKMKSEGDQSESGPHTEQGYVSSTEYIPNNTNDSHYMYRLSIFMDEFLKKTNKTQFEYWIPLLLRSLIYKLRVFPRSISLLKLFTTLNEIMENTNFFSSINGQNKDLQELCKMFYKELFEKYKEYQDELLCDSVKVLLSIPSHFIINDEQFIIKDLTLAIRKAFQIGLLNIYVASAAIDSLTRLVSKLPRKKALPFLNFITPMVSDFMVYEENIPIQNAEGEADPSNKFNIKITETQITKRSVCEKVLDFLGKLGGDSHMLIPSEFRDQAIDKNLAKEFVSNRTLQDSKKANLISWDHETTFTFPLPLYSKKIDIDLLKVIPKVVDIASTATDKKLKTTACELLHAFIVYMIGKSSQQGQRKGGKSKINFSNLYERIFPVIFHIAADPEAISTKIFNTLCLQIVRWFSSSREYENKETACLLDTLMNCVSVRDNSNLRDFAAVCIGEFTKWSIKQLSAAQIKENYGNIKSVIRRIQNNANHPDIYFRYGSVLALRQVVTYLREEDFLTEKYLLEITYTTLNILKMSAHSQTNTEEMKQNMTTLVQKLKDAIMKRWPLLEKQNDKRGAFGNVNEFLKWLFRQLLAYESEYREKCFNLWQSLIQHMIDKGIGHYRSHRAWIDDNIKNKNVLLEECQSLKFDVQGMQTSNVHEKIDLLRKNFKLYDSQIFTYSQFTRRGIISVDEYKKLGDLKKFVQNTQEFLPKFLARDESRRLSQDEEIIQNDGTLFKTKLTTLLHFFTLLSNSQKNLPIFLQTFMSGTLTRQQLYTIIFRLLISPFEGVDINPNYNIKVEQWRRDSSINLIKEMKKLEKEFQEDNKFFEQYFVNGFLVEHSKFNLTNKKSPLLSNLFQLTEFQVRSFFDGFESMYEGLFQVFTKKNIRGDFIGAHLDQSCEVILAFIARNIDGIDPNQEEKMLILLNFALKFSPSEDFLLSLINEDKVIFQKFQGQILDCIAKKLQFDQGNLSSKIFIQAQNNALMLRLLIPLVQRVLKIKPDYLNSVADVIRNLNFSGCDSDVILNFTKLFYVLLSKMSNKKFLSHDPQYRRFLQSFIIQNLDPRRNGLNVCLEIINFLGLYVMEVGNEYPTYHTDIIKALENIQSKFFPVSTNDLVTDSQDDQNFKMLLNALTNMLKMANRVELLKILYPIIREKECNYRYEKILSGFCRDWVRGLNTLESRDQIDIFNRIFNIFTDKYLDDQLENNIRFQIMRRIGFLILEELPLNALEDILIQHGTQLAHMVTGEQLKSAVNSFEGTVMVLQERSIANNCFKIFYSRLPADVLKNKISKRIYGESSNNELHKKLILPLHEGKSKPLINKDYLLNHEMNKKYPIEPFMREYHSMCFNALAEIIKGTQTKEGPFNTFLMHVAREKGQVQWELVIEKKEDFQFEVETSFDVTYIEKTEKKLKSNLTNMTLNNIIATKYLTESFFSQKSDHHGFLIMEFDPTQKEHQKSKKMMNKDIIIEEDKESDSDSDEEKIYDPVDPLSINFEEGKNDMLIRKKQPQKIELDVVNQHPCMKSILAVIDHLNSNFKDPHMTSMPGWMTGLHAEAIRPEQHMSVKIFLIKIIINKEEIFRPYARQWSEVLLNYCSSKGNGGKGFHYFLRDVCTTLLTWHANGFKLEQTLNNKKLCSDIITNLMKVAADKKSIVFRSNLKIIAGLMDHWRDNLYVDKDVLQKMLNFPEKNDGAMQWRMTALHILDSAFNYNIQLAQKDNFQNSDGISSWDNALVSILVGNLKFRLPLPYLASIVIGKLLKFLDQRAQGGGVGVFGGPRDQQIDERLKEIERMTTNFLISLCDKEPEKFALFLENISVPYNSIITSKNVFFQITNKIHNLTKKARGALFNTLKMFIEKTPNKIAIESDIQEICFSLQGSFDRILRDHDENNLVNFFNLLDTIVQLNSDHSRNLIVAVIDSLAKAFLDSTNEQIIEKFFKIVRHIYDQNDEELKDKIKSFLLRGLNHPLPSIHTKIFDFLNDENRIPLDPVKRMMVSMRELYSPDYESVWLKSTVPLMVSICKKSSDYERKLFDHPLDRQIAFKDYDPSGIATIKIVNRSQPLTPIFSLSQQKFDDLVKSTNDTGGDTEIMANKNEQNGSNNNLLSAGNVRATQRNLFSQTLVGGIIDEQEEQNPYGISLTQIAGSSGSGRERAFEQPRNRYTDSLRIQSGGNDNDNYLVAPITQELNNTMMVSTQQRRKPSSTRFGNFLQTNFLNVYNITPLDSNKVRYSGDGKKTNEKNEIRQKQRQLFQKRQSEIRKNTLSASRKYRIGELPDIEISHKDIIDPLVILASEDSEIASELFISIVENLYKKEENANQRLEYIEGMKRILQRSKFFDYNVVSNIHRAYLQILKSDAGINLDVTIVAESGLKALSYHTTVLLLEEILTSHFDIDHEERIKKSKRSGQQRAQQRQIEGMGRSPNQIQFEEEKADIWLHLIEVYSQLNEDDAVKGLLSIVMNDINVRNALDTKLDMNYGKSLQLFNDIIQEYDEADEPQSRLGKKIYEYMNDERTDCLAALGKWDVILKEIKYPGQGQGDIIPIEKLKDRDAFYLMKGLINNDEFWPTMNEYVLAWRGKERSRNVIDQKYGWEVGLLSITQKDFDRAKYFLDLQTKSFLKRWEKFDMFSEAAKHDQIQLLQKITEFTEFLNYIDKTRNVQENEIQREFISLCEKWNARLPSATYDSVHTWNDILFAREMFCNLISVKHYADNEQFVEQRIADFYLESAKGLVKKGILENADSLLNRSIRMKNQSQNPQDRQFNYKSIAAVIKLKLRILEENEERFSLDLGDYLQRYNQITMVIENQQKKFENKITEYNKNRIQLLKIRSKLGTLDFLYETYFLFKDSYEEPQELAKEMAVNADFVNNTFDMIMKSAYFTLASMNAEGEVNESSVYKGKIFHKYATFMDKILRIFEESQHPNAENIMVKAFVDQSINFTPKTLAQRFLNYLCDGFDLGYYKPEQLPKLFDIILKYPELADQFKEKSKKIPVWLFLKWLPQMMFFVNAKELSTYVEEIFLKIAELYPQAMIYQFNVAHDKLFNLENIAGPKTDLVQKIQAKLDVLNNHYAFILSLNNLTFPEHKLIHYYMDKIKEVLVDQSMDREAQLKLIARDIQMDIFDINKPFVGDLNGTYNNKFAQLWEKQFNKAFGKNLDKLKNYDYEKYTKDKQVLDFIQKLRQADFFQGKEKLATYSTWLANYDSNNYLYEAKIEIPGQYTSVNNEPFMPSHITISNFGQDVLVLGSIRRPKRITMHGSNEKSYNFLVKGIEDLRLDQRIEQLFSLMNEIFLQDTECLRRELKINTFQVIPMTKMLGVLEWVDNTAPIKNILGDQFKAEYDTEFDRNHALHARRKWLENIPENRGKGFAEMHMTLLGFDEKTITENFNQQQQLMPGSLLKKALERLCSSPEAFLYVKNKFIRNYATLSIASYILGVGDRHLENFLVSTNSGEVIPIDFGYSFGQGLTLSVPELMPFRLTRVFECLMQPMGVDGIFRNTMIHSLSALRKHRNVILDCCEIFVKDPLMDWLKTAKNKKLGMSGMSGSNQMVNTGSLGTESLSSLGIDDELIWYPKKKVEIVRRKLVGEKPSKIMEIELRDSKFFRFQQFQRQRNRIIEVVRGTPGTYRASLRDKVYLTISEQVDALVDQARDPNVLGRTWIGWSPFV